MSPRREQYTSVVVAMIIDHTFSPRRKSALTKQCLQQGYCQVQPIKVIPWVFPCKFRLSISHVLLCPYLPIPLLQVTKH
jgi:hypothetical protein